MGEASMEKQNFLYSAFISYKHLDKKEAEWIQKKLESYRLPAKLCKEFGLAKKLKKCFRDVDDLAGTLLKESIMEEMKQCKYMILICSPNVLENSQYINYEVETFRKLRGAEYIIPVIIDGSPDHPDPKQRCFPKAIDDYQSEYLGISFKQDGRHKALLKIIATILGVSADTIIKREQKRQKQRRLITAAFSACLIAVILSIANFYMPKSADYLDYALKDGVPIGIGELSSNQVAQKNGHFTITRQNVFEGLKFYASYQQYEVRYENKYNIAINPDNSDFAEPKVAIATYSFLADNSYRVEHFSAAGKSLVVFDYSSNRQIADFQNPLNDANALTLAANTVTTDIFNANAGSRSAITRYQYSYTNGYITKVIYKKNSLNDPAADANGIFGKEYIVDETNGQILEEFYLDINQQRISLNNGRYSTRYTYNQNHQLIKVETLNKQGEPIFEGSQPPIYQISYDQNLNISEFYYVDAEQELSLNGDGWAKLSLITANGLITDRHYLDTELKPTIIDDGYANINYSHDQQGRVSQIAYTDTENAAVLSKYGDAMCQFTYDQNGFISEYAYYDTAHNLTLIDDGYAIERIESDEQGNILQTAYYGIDRQPIIAKNGYASAKAVLIDNSPYDQYGNIIGFAYYDQQDNPVLSADGIASYRQLYDGRGNMVEESYYDSQGQLTIAKFGYALLKNSYDERGNHIGQATFDQEGQPIANGQGIAGWQALTNDSGQIIYDQWGNLGGYYSYDWQGAVTGRADGIAYIKNTYNDQGYLIEQWLYDQEEQLILGSDGYAGIKYLYQPGFQSQTYFGLDQLPIINQKLGVAKIEYRLNQYGAIEQELYYGLDNQPILDAYLGVAAINYSYDQQGNLLKTAYLGTEGLPILAKLGAAQIATNYDAKGNLLKIAYFDTAGQPIIATNDLVASIEYVYDQRGNNTATYSYGLDGQLAYSSANYAYLKSTYDQRDNLIEQTYFGTDRQPLLVDGYATIKRSYDQHDYVIRDSYYDTEGNLTITDQGYAYITFSNDYYGRTIEQTYWDNNQQMIINQDNYAQAKFAYDQYGRIIKIDYFGSDGRPTYYQEGYAGIAFGYDVLGNSISENYYDIDGNPSLNLNGHYAQVKAVYDQSGNKIEEAYYDLNNQLIIPVSLDYALIRNNYDDHGNLIEVAYYGTDNQPISNAEGIYSRQFQYDQRNNIISESFYDLDGLPINNNRGYAAWQGLYDQRGYLLESSYLGVDGKPTLLNDHGYAKAVQVFDQRGQQISISYFGLDGQPLSNAYGSAAWQTVYDLKGNPIAEYSYGTDNQLSLNNAGYAVVKKEFDAANREIYRAYYGIDEEPILLAAENFAAVATTYDQNGLIIEQTYYDTAGNTLFIDQFGQLAIIVLEVMADSPAEQAGLKPYDIIIGLNQWQMADYNNSQDLIDSFFQILADSLNRQKTLTVLRYDEATAIFNPYQFEFEAGSMGVRIVDQATSPEQFSSIINAINSI